METKYQAFTNQNNNISKINGLLEQIGTSSKSLFNKLRFKKSKSDEFIELISINLNKILENINLENVTRQLNKSKKLFEKLLGEFKNKIESKSPSNKARLKNQIDVIYNTNNTFFPRFSDKIYDIIAKNTLSIEQLNLLLSIQKELIILFEFYYKEFIKSHKNSLDTIENIKRYISKRIHFITPNNKSRSIDELFSECDSLYNQLMTKNESEIIRLNKQEKQELSAYIKDLAKFIYLKTIELNNGEILMQSVIKITKLSGLYRLIFIKEFFAIRISRKYSQFENWNYIIPNKNTYENIRNTKAQIESFKNNFLEMMRMNQNLIKKYQNININKNLKPLQNKLNKIYANQKSEFEKILQLS